MGSERRDLRTEKSVNQHTKTEIAKLYLCTLDSPAVVERLVAFCVEQHNRAMPHLAYDGRTPDEVHFGTANNLADELAARRRQAMAERLLNNRAIACSECAL